LKRLPSNEEDGADGSRTLVEAGASHRFCPDSSSPKKIHATVSFFQLEIEVGRGNLLFLQSRMSIFTTQYKGKMYYFCSSSCKREFEREPESFIKKMNNHKQ